MLLPSLKNLTPKLLGLAVLAASLVACAEFDDDPMHRRADRALKDNERVGDSISETQREPNGNNFNLLSINFGGKKDQPPEVHSILDPLKQTPAQVEGSAKPAAPASTAPTPPATNVVEQAATTAAANPIPELAWQQKPQDQVSMALDNDGNLNVYITSPSGIGGIILQRTIDNWPATIHVSFRYNPDKPFTTLEGFNAAEVLGEDRRLDLKTRIDKAIGKADITIPGFSRSQRIAIGWVDAYR